MGKPVKQATTVTLELDLKESVVREIRYQYGSLSNYFNECLKDYLKKRKAGKNK